MEWHHYIIFSLTIWMFPRSGIADMKNVNNVFLDKLSQMYRTNAATNSEAIRHFVSDIQDSCNADVITKPDHVISTSQLLSVCQENVTQCKHIIDEHCFDVQELLASMMKYGHSDSDDASKELTQTFPAVLFHMVHKPCIQPRNESSSPVTHHQKVPTWKAWVYGLLFVSLICFISNVGALLAPFQKMRFFQRVMLYCVGLAVGALAGTGFLVLVPESMDLTREDSPVPDYKYKLTTVLGGIYLFYVSELLLKLFLEGEGVKKTEETHSEDSVKLTTTANGMNDVLNDDVNDELEGHSHYPTKVPTGTAKTSKRIPSMALVILIGDAVHNFVDGIAIGAAFTENVYVGVSVSLAIICEELPHELGDIALLLHLGLSMKRALLYNFLAACTCYVGLVLGILLGENTDGNMWIFAVAGGMFIYIALVDTIPEMRHQANQLISKGIETPGITLLIQNCGMVTGFTLILILVLFGGGISVE